MAIVKSDRAYKAGFVREFGKNKNEIELSLLTYNVLGRFIKSASTTS